MKVLSPFLSLWYFYIWNPIFLAILFPTPNLGWESRRQYRVISGDRTTLGLGWMKNFNARNFASFVLCRYIYKKEKNEKTRKRACMGLIQPTTKPAELQEFSSGQKRSPPREAHSDMDILHQELRFISKSMEALPYFLSLAFLHLEPHIFLYSLSHS
jgi:hypothetical protein